MIGVEMRVVYKDGTVDLASTSMWSVIATERRFDLGVVTLFIGDDPRMEALWWLGWKSLEDAGVDVGDFDDWARRVAEFDVDPRDAVKLPPPPPDPTRLVNA